MLCYKSRMCILAVKFFYLHSNLIRKNFLENIIEIICMVQQIILVLEVEGIYL